MSNVLIRTIFTLSSLSIALTAANAWGKEPPNEEMQLERVEVTAQKRTQNLQDVPVAVTAISGNMLQRTVSQDIYDVAGYVPAFAALQSQSATNSSFSIRGIGTSSQNFGFESSVGLYVDGVYRSRQNAVVNDWADLEAVEILRGPQGTLFGKNTPAGAVIFRTKAPTFENGDGFVRATVGNNNLTSVSGATSINAIDDVLAFRIAGFTTQRDGWIDDANKGAGIINDRNRSGVRLQALYKPAESVNVRIIADYAELDEICCGALTWQDSQQANAIPGKLGTDALLMSPLFAATVYTKADFYNHTTALSQLPESSMQDKGLSAHVNWQISDTLSLVSITAVRAFDSIDNVDTDFTDADLLTAYNNARQQAFSQEVRLRYQSDDIDAMLGAYYYSQNLDLDFAIDTHEDFPAFFAASAAELQPLVEGINSLSALSGGLIAPSAAPAPAGTSFAHSAAQEQDSYAFFGQTDWAFTDHWTLTTGLRYTHEEKSLTGEYHEKGAQIEGLPVDPAAWPNPQTAAVALQSIGGALSTGNAPSASDLVAIAPFQEAGWGYFFLNTASILPRPDLQTSHNDHQVTGTAKLAWQRNDSQLLYTSFATGFKAGGINTDRISPALDPKFNAEKARSVEIGIKQDIDAYHLRINVAAHLTNIEDFQASTFTGTGFNLQNAGDISVKGIEAEIVWLPLPDTRIDIAAARTLATFDAFDKGTCWVSYPWHTGIDDPGRPEAGAPYCSRAGDRVGFTPENTLSIKASQGIALADWDTVLSIDYQYTGSLYLDDSNDPYKYSESFSLVNLRWQLNIPDYDFTLIAWGRNILNEEYAAKSGFDVPVQTGKIMAYPGQPATYGLTVQKSF